MKSTSFNKLSFLRTLLTVSRTPSATSKNSWGFTLIELLVVVVIAGGIISGLLYLVVELLTADQRESSRTQTQQEMQMALDYISAELREAVYIYDEECLGSSAHGTTSDVDYCPGLYNHIPSKLTPANNSYPILAFWKHQIWPSVVREACDDLDDTDPLRRQCQIGHSYALVVYTLDKSNSDTWDGLARIRRYSLPRFQTSSSAPGYEPVDGYVDPGAYMQEFRSWPIYASSEGGTPENQQATAGTLVNDGGDVLVDFVDDRLRVSSSAAACPSDYLFAHDTNIAASIANSFYACVGNRDEIGQNRDVIVFLRGNAAGRDGIHGENSFLPTLETRVLSRAVIERLPISE
jgi:prepilin-type N-terminal cleavage/methylation domain-containing protein